MFISNYRVTYQTAPHEIIDTMIMNEEKMDQFYQSLMSIEGLEEAVVLQTCNRFEVYVSGKALAKESSVIDLLIDTFDEQITEHLVRLEYLGTLKHLFKVVSSLDSMIVGENQILAQVKEASAYASAQRYSGKVLGPIFQKAISVGKKVRAETDISKGKVSISSAAVELANKHLPLENKKVVIVGTGKMASLLGEYLQGFNVKELVVIGRTPERHNKFCDQFAGRAIAFNTLSDELRTADCLFSATSCPSVLIHHNHIENGMKDKNGPLVLVDIAMPADIEGSVGDIDGVTYFSIDDLKQVSEQNLASRQDEVARAEEIIQEELQFVKRKLQGLHMEFYLSNLMKYTEEVREQELGRAYEILGPNCTDPEKVKDVLDGLSRSLVNKVMHNFVTAVHQNPAGEMDLRKFVAIFMGNGNGPKPPQGGHPHGEHPPEGHPHGGHPPEGHPHGGHPHGGHPHGGHPHGEHLHGGHPHGGHPHGEHPHGEHPHGGHPHGGHPHETHPHEAASSQSKHPGDDNGILPDKIEPYNSDVRRRKSERE
jgi:glutamyl-tRNA reductase